MRHLTQKDLNRLRAGLKLQPKPVPHEEISCKELFGYLNLLSLNRTRFLFSHIPNGGKRHKKVAADLQAMGVLSGMWDYWFRMPGLPTHWLEMKWGKNDLTHEQLVFGEYVRQCGDTTDVCWSAFEALEKLKLRGFIPDGAYTITGSLVIINQKLLAPNQIKGA